MLRIKIPNSFRFVDVNMARDPFFGRRDNIGNLLAGSYGFPFVTTLLQCTGNAKIWKKRIRALAHSSSVNGRYDDSLDCASAWRILSIVFAFYRILVQ